MWTLLLIATLPPTHALDVRFVDLQQLVLASPLGERAADHLAAARADAQARIDAARRDLARTALTPPERSQREAALAREMKRAEASLEVLQGELLDPILAQYEHRRLGLEAEGRAVARLDQVALIGWPDSCEVTDALRTEENPALGNRAECRAQRIRTVDLGALAASSPEALRRQAELDALRDDRQAVIDKDRQIIQFLEAKAATPAERTEAARKRAKLDARVRRFRERLAAETEAAQEAVLDGLYARIARAAKGLEGVLIVDGAAPEWSLPVEDGQAWAETLLSSASK
ncbi:MAG: hypothetical protein AAFU79_29835 [Myxococcota bacterium]